MEYKFVDLCNSWAHRAGLKNSFFTNVVANRFPDFEVRSRTGQRGLRIEVKCIQCVAEEKSANFDVLKKDLDPRSDFVIVFLWEWFFDESSISWDRAPKMIRAFVLHAHSLAVLRDERWLSRPPHQAGEAFQGFDLRFAVTARNSSYSEEQGNYGKLLRIWPDAQATLPSHSELVKECAEQLIILTAVCAWEGFAAICDRIFVKHLAIQPVRITSGEQELGFVADRRAAFLEKQIADYDAMELARHWDFTSWVIFNEKYQWSAYDVVSGRRKPRASGVKPKDYLTYLFESLNLGGIDARCLR